MEHELEWYSPKKGGFFRRNDSITRTTSLVDAMEQLQQGDFHAIKFREDNQNRLFNLTRCGHLDNGLNSDSFEKLFKQAIAILKQNPKMLEYAFKKEGQLEDIIVHNAVDYIKQFKQDDSTLCEKACIVHAALEMFMHLKAVDKVGSSVPYKPPTILMTGNLSEKCRLGIGYRNSYSNGGSKSQRKRRNRTRHRYKHNVRPTKRRRN
jgi:hypothetical protein